MIHLHWKKCQSYKFSSFKWLNPIQWKLTCFKNFQGMSVWILKHKKNWKKNTLEFLKKIYRGDLQ